MDTLGVVFEWTLQLIDLPSKLLNVLKKTIINFYVRPFRLTNELSSWWIIHLAQHMSYPKK